MPDLKQSVKDKIEELSFAQYEGNVEGLLIIVIHKGTFKIMPAYDSGQSSLINAALDIAKDDLLQAWKTNTVKDM